MNLEQLTAEWLWTNGFDGLCHPDTECGCQLDDLMPCDEPGCDCVAGYRGPSTDPACTWMIYTTKEAATAAESEKR